MIGLPIQELVQELEKNEKIRNNIQQSLEGSSCQRKTLGKVLKKIFETVQDKIHQLSTQLTQVTNCLEGTL